MTTIPVNIKLLSKQATIPTYAHEGDSGFDIRAVKDVYIAPGSRVKVSTGLAFEIPDGYELQIRPRSGITSKTGLRVQLGTIDAGYRGEVSVLVDNIDTPSGTKVSHNIRGETDQTLPYEYHRDGYIIHIGDRIAQAVLVPVYHAEFSVVDEFTDVTSRGANGFGSTGV
jgi:dUTP pyrophosphatase